MEYQTANKVLRKTFDHLEQMLDEKNRGSQKGQEKSTVVAPADLRTSKKRRKGRKNY